MKALIAYYSFTGKTARLAHALEEYLKSEKHEVSVEEIKPEKPYSTLAAYTVGCRDAMAKKAVPIVPPRFKPADFGCVAVLSPTWAWTHVPPVTSYLAFLPDAKKGQLAIAGSTGGSNGACSHIADALKKKGYGIAGELFIKSFPDIPLEGELRKLIASSLRLG